ncbi:MAG: hypothetical protein ACFFBD_08505 [Candidatus Hodarchaeota archaeon]
MSQSAILLAFRQLRKELLILGIVAVLYIVLTSFLFREEMKILTDLHIGDIYLYFLVPALCLFFFTGLIFFQMYKSRNSSLLLICLTMFVFGLSYFFGFLNWDPTGSSAPLTRLFAFQLLFSNLATIIFALHFELLEHPSPRSWFLSAVFFLLSPSMVLNVYEIISGNVFETDTFNIKLFTIILTQIGTLLVFYRVLHQAAAVWVRTQTYGVITTSLAWQFFGVCIFVVHVLLEILDAFLSVYNTPWLLMAVLVMTWAYVQDPTSILLRSTNILVYGVMDSGGLAYYLNAVDPFFRKRAEENSLLFTALISAMQTFSQDVAGAKRIENMNFPDRTLIIEYRAPFYLICIANRANYFLLNNLDRYLRQVIVRLEDLKFKISPGASEITDEIKQIFKDCDRKFFPYVRE